ALDRRSVGVSVVFEDHGWRRCPLDGKGLFGILGARLEASTMICSSFWETADRALGV
ncbi:unnamed protein product, partial [Symbiodinium sp. KB8]